MHRFILSTLAILMTAQAVKGQAGALILNEFNAVGGEEMLQNDDFSWEGYDYGNLRQQTLYAGANAGRFIGNGGNWLELVVTKDHLDIRGWTLNWSDTDLADPPASGQVVFSNHSIWSSLRAGTIITVVEDKDPIPVFPGGSEGPPLNLTSDISFKPSANDWWINVELSEESPYVTTPGEGNGYRTSNDNWQLTIKNAFNQIVQGPIGESVNWGNGGINNEEVGQLHADPGASVTGPDYRDHDLSTFGAPNLLDPFEDAVLFTDLETQDFGDATHGLRRWFYRTDRIAGDANLDRQVNVLDMLILANNWMTGGHDWMEGDFNGDGLVNATDLGMLGLNWLHEEAILGAPFEATATQLGLIPEPATMSLVLLPVLGLFRRRRA